MDRLHKHIATLLEGLVEEAQGRNAAEPEPEANSDSYISTHD